jgi:hypothetical protein
MIFIFSDNGQAGPTTEIDDIPFRAEFIDYLFHIFGINIMEDGEPVIGEHGAVRFPISFETFIGVITIQEEEIDLWSQGGDHFGSQFMRVSLEEGVIGIAKGLDDSSSIAFGDIDGDDLALLELRAEASTFTEPESGVSEVISYFQNSL